MKKKLTINGYGHAHCTHGAATPREPLVHIMGFEHPGGDLQSISFKPKNADMICAAILLAAKVAQNDAPDVSTAVETEDYYE